MFFDLHSLSPFSSSQQTSTKHLNQRTFNRGFASNCFYHYLISEFSLSMVQIQFLSVVTVLLASSSQVLAIPGLFQRDTACRINSGQSGVCISTSSCSGSGGSSQAGHCPGPIDIQCCTYGTCSVSGVSGTCQETSTCSGTKTPGHCPGPSNIQCCTHGSSGGCGAPEVNEVTINLIESFESWRPNPCKSSYLLLMQKRSHLSTDLDPDGNPSIGWGHLCSEVTCANIGYPIPLSLANGDKLLQSDLKVCHCLTRVFN